MNQDPVASVEAMMAGRIGLRTDPGFRGRLEQGMQDEAALAGVSLESYLASVVTDSDAFQRLLNRITVQQTWFFRDAEVFEALAAHVMPTLHEPVVAWSAGCSNGQEAYSLAMLLAETGIRRWTVLGTDISTKALERASGAAYSDEEVEGVSARRRRLHLRRRGDGWEVLPALREHVRFQHHNLGGPSVPHVGGCQLILCRNVLIYFSPEELRQLVERFASVLDPSGYLVLGMTESLWQLSDRFQAQRVGGVYMYRLRTP